MSVAKLELTCHLLCRDGSVLGESTLATRAHRDLGLSLARITCRKKDAAVALEVTATGDVSTRHWLGAIDVDDAVRRLVDRGD